MTVADNSTTTTLTVENYNNRKSELPFFARGIFSLLLNAKHGKISITLPDGHCFHVNSGQSGPSGQVTLHNWKPARKVALAGTIGVAESYIDHDWDSPNVSELLRFFLINKEIYQNVADQSAIMNMIGQLRNWINSNTRDGSKRNIAAHYDLGNEFYREWLDPSMTYSSAIFEDGANSLERAQQDKYKSLATRMGITKDSHVLEIGCGWGGFAEYVAKEIGARITGLTISQEQLKYARERIEKAGLQDRAEFRFQDYRDETGKYDHIASIEMFEAVGEKYWPVYFGKIRDCLKPGGTAGLQIITIANENFDAYRNRMDFIQRYIFPGGMLPSPEVLQQVTTAEDLKLVSERIFPQDYARTLKEWRLQFWSKWDKIKTLGFDERFKRMWEFYLYYCEAGFSAEGIDVRQVFYSRK
ncbi:MAG: cyclopropane-fatty-acyl-phospholipid synthase family protein [Pseudomonadota bacterium]